MNGHPRHHINSFRAWHGSTFRAIFVVLMLAFVAQASPTAMAPGAPSQPSGRVLRVAGFYPFSLTDGKTILGRNGLRIIAGASMLAVEHFNSRNGTVLPALASEQIANCNVTLNMSLHNTFASPYEGVRLVRDLRRGGETLLDAIVGPTFSAVATSASIAASIDSIPMVSYWATSPELDRFGIYPYFMRTIPSDAMAAVAAVAWFVRNKWQRVGVISVDDSYGRGYSTALVKECTRQRVTCESVSYETWGYEGDDELVLASMAERLHVLAQLKLNVFFAVLRDLDFNHFINTTVTLNLMRPDTAWTFSDSIGAEAFEALRGRAATASIGMAKLAATGAIDGHPGNERLRRAIRAKPAAWYNQFLHTIGDSSLLVSDPVEARKDAVNYAYDAVVTIGLGACAVEAAESAEKGNGDDEDDSFELETVKSLGSDPYSLALLSAMLSTNFEGASGPVKFEKPTGSREPTSATFGIENVVSFSSEEYESIPNDALVTSRLALLWTDDNGWREVVPFYFADGTEDAPSDKIPEDICPPGEGWSGTRCVPCERGTYRNAESASLVCLPCNEFEYQPEQGKTRCKRCGSNAHIINYELGSRDPEKCICDDNAYARKWPIGEEGCTLCDESNELVANCVGGTCLPFPSRGTWLSIKTSSPIKSYACRYSFLCTGGTRPVAASGDYADKNNQTCVNSEGLTLHLDVDGEREWCLRGWSSNAPLCEDARVKPNYEKDYFLVATVASKCPNNVRPAVFTVFCWIILLLCFFLINDVLRPNYRVLDIVLEIYQDMGVVASFRYAWPIGMQRSFILFDLALFDADAYEPTCLVRNWGAFHAFWLMCSLPVVYCALRFTWTALSSCRIRCDFSTSTYADSRTLPVDGQWDRAFGSCLAFTFRALPSLIINVESMFMCRKFQGQGWRLAASPADECNSQVHSATRLFAIFYFFTIIIGLPLAVIIQLMRSWTANELCERKTLMRFGFLYQAFGADALYWGVMRFFKQAVLCTISVVAWKSPRSQAIMAIFVLMIVIARHAKVQPCIHDVENRFELVGLAMTTIMALVGFLFTTGNASSASSNRYDLADGRRTHLEIAETRTYRVIYFSCQALYLACALAVTRLEHDGQAARRETRLRFMLWDYLRESEKMGSSLFENSFSSVSLQRAATQIIAHQAVVFKRKITRRFSSMNPQERSTGIHSPRQQLPSELLLTFKGRVFRNFARSLKSSEDIDVAFGKLLELDEAISDFVADHSLTNNYSNSYEASIFRSLDRSFPSILDLFIDCSEKQRTVLTNAVSSIVRASYLYNASGAQKSSCIEGIDRSSCLFFLMYCPERKRALFKEMIEKLVRADPLLGAKVHRANAIKLALLLQRYFRRRQFYEAVMARRLSQIAVLDGSEVQLEEDDDAEGQGQLPEGGCYVSNTCRLSIDRFTETAGGVSPRRQARRARLTSALSWNRRPICDIAIGSSFQSSRSSFQTDRHITAMWHVESEVENDMSPRKMDFVPGYDADVQNAVEDQKN